jgi:hypothetical protein
MTAETITLSADATIHPRWVRVCHWINALAILVMIGSGWQISNASPLFGFIFLEALPSAAGLRVRCSGISRPCGCLSSTASLRDAWHSYGPFRRKLLDPAI